MVLSVIKSFIIQLKFLYCNTSTMIALILRDSGDDVLLFLYHVNNKSSFLRSLARAVRAERPREQELF